MYSGATGEVGEPKSKCQPATGDGLGGGGGVGSGVGAGGGGGVGSGTRLMSSASMQKTELAEVVAARCRLSWPLLTSTRKVCWRDCPAGVASPEATCCPCAQTAIPVRA